MKNYFKPVLFILGLLLFTISCQKDDTPIPEEEDVQIESLKAFNITSKDIPSHILDFVKTKTNNTFKVNISKRGIKLSNSNVNAYSRETLLGIVQTNKVVQVYNERNTKYTFKVTDPTNSNSVINLVVVDMSGDIIEYFIQYIFDPNISVPRLSSGAIDMSRFTGGMIFYNMEGLIIGNFILNDGDLVDFDGEIDPCPEDEVIEEEEDDTDGNNNSNSGGGNNNNSDPNNNNDDDTDNTSNSSSGTNNTNDNTSNGNDNTNDGGGAGDFTDPDTGDPCDIVISFGSCECGGNADGHGASECGCNTGSPVTVTNTCTGVTTNYYNRSAARGITGGTSPCDGEVGILVEEDFENHNEIVLN